MKLPVPLSMHLTVVGGDGGMSDNEEAWKAAWMVVSTRIHLAPPGSMVMFGPQKGSPDVLASASAARYGKLGVLLDRDGVAYASAPFSREGHDVPFRRMDCGRWSDAPTPEGLASELANQLALAKASGWTVECIILHGWDGRFRGERLSEYVRHLGVSTQEWDVSKEGATLPRD